MTNRDFTGSTVEPATLARQITLGPDIAPDMTVTIADELRVKDAEKFLKERGL